MSPTQRLLWLFWNPDERRLRALMRIVIHLGLFILIMALGAPLLLAPVWGNLRLQQNQAWADIYNPAVGGLVQGLAVLLSVWLAARFLDRRPFADLGFHLDRIWWRDLAFGLFLGALLMTGVFLVEWAAGWAVVVETTRSPQGIPFALAIWGPLILFLCVGFYEELLSRGYWLRNLAEGLSFPPLNARGGLLLAYLITSTLFGLLHLGNPNATWVSTANLILAGFLLGLPVLLTGELAISIGLHITWNFFQGNVYGFPVSGLAVHRVTFIAVEQRGPDLWTGGAFGPEAGLVGVGAMAVGTLLVLWWVFWTRGRLRLHTEWTQYRPLSRVQTPSQTVEASTP